MERSWELLLRILRHALRGEQAEETILQAEDWSALRRLAAEHSVLPLVADALFGSPAALASPQQMSAMTKRARNLTILQAARTGEFLLLYRALRARGMDPVVLKGIVCRSLYLGPELRPSVDEDLWIETEQIPLYHEALLAAGLTPEDPTLDLHTARELNYKGTSSPLYIELHASPFPDSDAYGDCNALFEGAQTRTVSVTIEGEQIRTLAPTDHLLYLICHAYKHFLHGGVGIRQICDMALFAEHHADGLDWARIAEGCERIHIRRFAAALFRVAERHLGFASPAAFDEEIDELPLLADVLSGGLYGVNDIDRAHSSTLTLEAVASQRQGRRSGGALRSLFPPASSLKGRYPYLRRHRWLLPAAWAQRAIGYLNGKNDRQSVNPAKSLQIGRERIELLRSYDIIE